MIDLRRQVTLLFTPNELQWKYSHSISRSCHKYLEINPTKMSHKKFNNRSTFLNASLRPFYRVL